MNSISAWRCWSFFTLIGGSIIQRDLRHFSNIWRSTLSFSANIKGLPGFQGIMTVPESNFKRLVVTELEPMNTQPIHLLFPCIHFPIDNLRTNALRCYKIFCGHPCLTKGVLVSSVFYKSTLILRYENMLFFLISRLNRTEIPIVGEIGMHRQHKLVVNEVVDEARAGINIHPEAGNIYVLICQSQVSLKQIGWLAADCFSRKYFNRHELISWDPLDATDSGHINTKPFSLELSWNPRL